MQNILNYLLDELSQYNLKQIDFQDIEINSYNFTQDKYYICVKINQNLITDIRIYSRISSTDKHELKKWHIYKIQDCFTFNLLHDIFYNCCVNIYKNMTHFNQIYFYVQTTYLLYNNQVIYYISYIKEPDIKLYDFIDILTNVENIENLNDLNEKFNDAMIKHEFYTKINIKFN